MRFQIKKVWDDDYNKYGYEIWDYHENVALNIYYNLEDAKVDCARYNLGKMEYTS